MLRSDDVPRRWPKPAAPSPQARRRPQVASSLTGSFLLREAAMQPLLSFPEFGTIIAPIRNSLSEKKASSNETKKKRPPKRALDLTGAAGCKPLFACFHCFRAGDLDFPFEHRGVGAGRGRDADDRVDERVDQEREQASATV